MPAELYLCLHLRDFAAQTLACGHAALRSRMVAVLSGKPPLEYVFALNQRAREEGLELGMSRIQAESFAGAVLLMRDRAQEEKAFAEIVCCADRFSPRVQAIAAPGESSSGVTLILDVANSERLLGTAPHMAEMLLNEIRALGYEASIAASRNACTAVLAARGRPGITIIAAGDEANSLAPLPLSVLKLPAEQAETLDVWGIRTLGQLAALPIRPLIARIGVDGHRLHSMACGQWHHLLVPEEPAADAVLVEHAELEHPVELLEPLLFLLCRTLEKLTERAAQHALAIAAVETCLTLAGAPNAPAAGRSEYCRTVRPALPERDFHTLLKLVQLDMELHPPQAPIVAFTLRAYPARPQNAQHGLFAAQSPEAGRTEVLLARLRKLVGEERVGVPELLDSHAPEAFRMTGFQPAEMPAANDFVRKSSPTSALRMMRPPLAIRVGMSGSGPATLFLEGARVSVQARSGPWRASGAWWSNSQWCREEWDIAVDTPQQRCLRLAYDHGANCWYLIGIYD